LRAQRIHPSVFIEVRAFPPLVRKDGAPGIQSNVGFLEATADLSTALRFAQEMTIGYCSAETAVTVGRA
jgi:hypothetical protein